MWQKQEIQRKAGDAEARSVALQPIQNHKAQRIKNKLSNCLNKAVRGMRNKLLDDVPRQVLLLSFACYAHPVHFWMTESTKFGCTI